MTRPAHELLTRFGLVACLAAPKAALCAGAGVQAATVTGTVTDTSKAPIRGVEVLAIGTGVRTYSDEAGHFALEGVPVGRVTITARRLGFSPSEFTLFLTQNETRDVIVVLSMLSVEIEEVVVRSPAAERLYADFERRRHTALGVFITEDEIDRRKPHVASELFRRVNGVRVVTDGSRTIIESAREALVASCPMRVFIDGNDFPLFDLSLDSYIEPTAIGAIEIYRGISNIPPQFAGRESPCGIVAIWTRSGKINKAAPRTPRAPAAKPDTSSRG
jgi:hypothetical protein